MPRYSVRNWNKKALQAASMHCGCCTEASGLVGIDFIAQNGKTFAHGHFDLDIARQFHQAFADAIAEAERKQMQ